MDAATTHEDEQEENDLTRKGQLTARRILSIIALPDEQGHYQVDDGCDISALGEGVEELLGVLIGYVSGPLHPETSEERREREAAYILIAETVTVG